MFTLNCIICHLKYNVNSIVNKPTRKSLTQLNWTHRASRISKYLNHRPSRQIPVLLFVEYSYLWVEIVFLFIDINKQEQLTKNVIMIKMWPTLNHWAFIVGYNDVCSAVKQNIKSQIVNFRVNKLKYDELTCSVINKSNNVGF